MTSVPSPSPGVAPARTPTPIDAVAESYLARQAELDPIFATVSGLPEYPDRLTDNSPAGHAARAHLARTTLAELSATVPRDDVDRVTAAALRERADQVVAIHEAGLDLADLNNIACPVQQVRDVFDVAATDTVEDWEAVAARLHAVPQALRGYAESLRAAVDAGWRPPVRQVRIATEQAGQFGARDGFFHDLAAGARSAQGPVPAALAERLLAGADVAADGYGELAGWLTERLLPAGRPDDGVGAELYQLCARSFLGSRIEEVETYAWAERELDRIERRMVEVAARIVPDATVPAGVEDGLRLVDAAIELLDADPARWITGAEAFRDWMQQLSDTAVAALAGTHFEIADRLRRLQCRIAPSDSGSVYYTGPSEDFSRPGQMWWSVPPEVTALSTWRETSTVYHEGVPGHHLQIGQAAHRADRLNRWRRLGCWVSGHGEGWALYAERLMGELGFLSDPGDELGMLDGQALRACRVLVDIGVHLGLPAPAQVGGGRWDADKAWAFLSAHTRMPEPNRRFELDRYLGWPGQAISYKVGERVWLDLRRQVADRQGADFDLRAFHARALDLGSMGLDVFRQAMLEGQPEGQAEGQAGGQA